MKSKAGEMGGSISNFTKIMQVFVAKAGKGIGGLVLTYVLARKYGAFGSGLFFIAYTFAFLCAQFSQLGLGNACLKFAPVLRAEKKENLNFLWTFTLIAVGSAALIFSGAVLSFTKYFSNLLFEDQGYTDYIIAATPIIFFWALTYLIVFFRQSLGDVSGITLIENSLIPWGMIAVSVAACVTDMSVLHLLMSISVLYAFTFVYAFVSTRKKYSLRFSFALDSSVGGRDIAAYSLPLLVIAFAQWSMVSINTLIIGGLGNVADSAIFVSGMKIGVSITILLYAFNSVYVPHISAAYAGNDHEAVNRLYSDITASLSIFSFIIIVLALLYSDLIMDSFGTGYISGVNCLVFLIIGNIFNCYIGPVGYVLIMSGKTRIDAYNTLVAFVVNVVLCFVLYQVMGVTGAGVAFCVSIVLLNLMRYMQCKSTVGLNWIDPIKLKIVLIQVVFCFLFFVLQWILDSRELLSIVFVSLYLLVNMGNIRSLVRKLRQDHNWQLEKM